MIRSWRCVVLFFLLAAVLAGRAVGQDSALDLFEDGFELLERNDVKRAIENFEKGLKLKPQNALAHFYLAEALRASGRMEDSYEHYERSLTIDSKSTVAEQARTQLKKMAEARPGRAFRDCSVCPEMVVIPAGTFTMGSPPSDPDRFDNESPSHVVTIARPFAVGKFEVTFDEWDACVAEKACPAVDAGKWGRGKRPVINVTVIDAFTYAHWISRKTGKSYRLLSEAEWEYAERGGSAHARHWGPSIARACEFANVFDLTGQRADPIKRPTAPCDDHFAGTAPAGSFKPNAFGLYDMLGNVFEYVADCWNSNYKSAPADGSAWATGDCNQRTSRGGSWAMGPDEARSAFRGYPSSVSSSDFDGFRVAMTLP